MTHRNDQDMDQILAPPRRNKQRQLVDPLTVDFKERQVTMGSVLVGFTHGPPTWAERDLRCGQTLIVTVGREKTKMLFREVEAAVAGGQMEPEVERVMLSWLEAVRVASPYTLKELVADQGLVDVAAVLEVEYPSLRHRIAGRVSMSVEELYTLYLQYPQLDFLATAREMYLLRHATAALSKKGK